MELLIFGTNIAIEKEFIVDLKRCVQFVTSWVNSDFINTTGIAFGLVYCSAVLLITDLM